MEISGDLIGMKTVEEVRSLLEKEEEYGYNENCNLL